VLRRERLLLVAGQHTMTVLRLALVHTDQAQDHPLGHTTVRAAAASGYNLSFAIPSNQKETIMRCKSIGLFAAVQILFFAVSTASCADIEPGLYLRTLYAGGHLDISSVYFAAGNKIAVDPNDGVDPFDFDAAAKKRPDLVGTYKLNGDKIDITWANGKSDSFSVEFEKGKISALNGGLMSKADAFPKDKKLAATYANIGTTKNVSGSFTITLTSDGKFTTDGLGGIRGIPGNTGVAEKITQGTYKLSGNTLILTTSDGAETKHTVMPFSTALDPAKAKMSDEHLIFDSANLKREK
jgi:hypothetical protein